MDIHQLATLKINYYCHLITRPDSSGCRNENGVYKNFNDGRKNGMDGSCAHTKLSVDKDRERNFLKKVWKEKVIK